MRTRTVLALILTWTLAGAVPAADAVFRRGDANQDGGLDLSDPVKVFSFLFLGDPAPGCDDALDLNDDGVLDISDGIYALAWLFTGGSPPGLPFPDCGTDATADSLGCTSYSQCCLSESVVATSVSVTNTAGAAPRKGDALRVTLKLENRGTHSGLVTVAPRLRSNRFNDFIDVPFGSVEVALGTGEVKEVTVVVGPFLDNDVRGKHYAIGRGGYSITGIRFECAGGPAVTRAVNRTFTVAASNVVFTAVVYDQGYFNKIRYLAGPDKYLTTAFTRRSEVFTPDAPGSSTGTYQSFPGGFDEMLGIHQVFRVFKGFAASSAAGGFCEQADAYARTALGLTRDWDIGSQATDPDHHGFDVLVGLTQTFGGGATCGWLGTQVSGLFDFDLSLNRSQLILVHEMGHIFGSPHCDPLQGYVMCAGEKHPHYTQSGIFVWHRVSLDAMRNPYD